MAHQHLIYISFRSIAAIITQGNIIDNYHIWTHKKVKAYKWITGRCRNAQLNSKSDDDVVVNMYS